MVSNFTDLKTKDMTKADFIEVLDKYDSSFTLETGEKIQAIYFYDFGKLADDLCKQLESELKNDDPIRLILWLKNHHSEYLWNSSAIDILKEYLKTKK